jgi:hypothetical protein
VCQTDGSVANHPNLWYQTSVQYHRAKNGATTSSDGKTGAGEEMTESQQAQGGAGEQQEGQEGKDGMEIVN